jgi:TPR repeat protein
MILLALILFLSICSYSYANNDNVVTPLKSPKKALSKIAEIDNIIEKKLLKDEYEDWDNVLKSHKNKLFFLKKAANKNNLFAQEMLAYMLWYGLNGVSQSYDASIYWYEKAARNKSVNSQYLLGLIYLHGKEVPQDFEIAFKWLMQAADNGNVKSQYLLGLMYYGGFGTNKNIFNSYLRFKLASFLGNKEASILTDKLGGELSKDEIQQADKLSKSWIKSFNQKFECVNDEAKHTLHLKEDESA